jgi:hypothetical protein
VVALLGDSVVSVAYCDDRPRRDDDRIGYALFAVAAVAFLLSFLAFRTGVAAVGAERAALQRWLELERRPVHEFRPVRLSSIHDWLAVGGALGGMLALAVALARRRELRPGSQFRIGSAPDVEFPVAGLPVETFPLVARAGDELVCHVAPGMEAALIEGRKVTPLAALQEQRRAWSSLVAPGAVAVPVPTSGRLRVRIGAIHFLVGSVERPCVPPVLGAPLLLEGAVLRHLAGSTTAVLGSLALLYAIPPDPRSLSRDLLDGSARLSRVTTAAREESRREESAGSGSAAAAPGEEPGGRNGGEASEPAARRGRGRAAGGGTSDPRLTREQAVAGVQHAGILGALRRAPGGAFAAITATGDFSPEDASSELVAGVLDDEGPVGGWGFSVRDGGPGGRGGPGLIGAGRYATIGDVPGAGPWRSGGPGQPSMQRRRPIRSLPVRIGQPTGSGDLDKEIIRRHVRRQLPQLTHCYERQLVVDAGLRGTVIAEFQISPQGAVLSATASGMGNAAVEQCVAGVLRAIQFPRPRGGGLVNVRYPLTFQPAG